MPFLQPVCFRVRLAKPQLLNFLAQAPVGSYVFIALSDDTLYGVFENSDVLEYFCNEFLIDELVIVESKLIGWAQQQARVRVWGTISLIDL